MRPFSKLVIRTRLNFIDDKGDRFYILFQGKVKILKHHVKNVEMNVDQYFDYLLKLRNSNDSYLLKQTIQANKHIFMVYLKDVKYLKKIIRKVRIRHQNYNKKIVKPAYIKSPNQKSPTTFFKYDTNKPWITTGRKKSIFSTDQALLLGSDTNIDINERGSSVDEKNFKGISKSKEDLITSNWSISASPKQKRLNKSKDKSLKVQFSEIKNEINQISPENQNSSNKNLIIEDENLNHNEAYNDNGSTEFHLNIGSNFKDITTETFDKHNQEDNNLKEPINDFERNTLTTQIETKQETEKLTTNANVNEKVTKFNNKATKEPLSTVIESESPAEKYKSVKKKVSIINSTLKNIVSLNNYDYVINKHSRNLRIFEYEYFCELKEGSIFGDDALDKDKAVR